MTARIRITQIDGKIPNLALMRLSAWHKARGDAVTFSRSVRKDLFEGDYDRVYGSAIFSFSGARIEKLKRNFANVVIGGTGSGSRVAVEDIVDPAFRDLDYSLYPTFPHSIGFTQRGCRLQCKFCVVPDKEGRPYHDGTVNGIWRGPGFPRNLLLLDNDFFGGPRWRRRVEEIAEGNFRVCLNQGVNVRSITAEAAEALASIEYRDDQFRRRRLYTAWDNLGDAKAFFRGIDRLEQAGIPPSHVMAYMLVGYDPRETWERIFSRFDAMVARGVLPYPMVYDPRRKDLKRFQRWVVRGLYRAVPWSEYTTSRTARRRRSGGVGDLFEIGPASAVEVVA